MGGLCVDFGPFMFGLSLGVVVLIVTWWFSR